MRPKQITKPARPRSLGAWFYFLGIAALMVALVPVPVAAGNFYAGTTPTTVPWTNGIVPYEFTNTLSTAEQQTYLDGLREWQLAGNVQFIPHTTQTHWVLFAYNTNGFDNVSTTTNPQVVSVASLSRAQVCHEMGHSFGFTHENIRYDATNFITVLTNHITNEAVNIVWFTIDPTTVTNGNYDFESVMHLGWDIFSTNSGVAATQQPKPPYFPRYQFRMGNFCLSPGDRAALKYLYGPPTVTLTNVVTNTIDSGPGTLRAALYYATDHPGTTIRFNIPVTDPGYSNGVYNIHLTGMLPPLVTNGMVIDGSTQPGFTSRPIIFVDGSQILPETYTSDTGLLFYSASSQVKNISFSGFNWNGLTLVYPDATNNTIAGCWVGADATGTNAAPNAYQGVLIESGASGNIIGGTNALARNVISGNSQYGVFITDSNTTRNVVLGNYLGTSAPGTNALPNVASGVFIGNGAYGNTIGSTNSAGRNVLSGNSQFGVFITDPNTTNNTVLGNYIGTDFSGSNAVPNGLSGIKVVNAAHNNFFGGTNVSARNVISGNFTAGIYFTNAGVMNNLVQGNYIGLNAAGTAALPNQLYGVYLLSGAAGNTIGGSVAGAGNVIAGNLSYGVYISDPGTSNNLVQGNYIGTDMTGTNGIGNGGWGVGILNSASANLIGGTSTGARNLISGNPGFSYGIAIINATGNLIQGNFIGTDPTGKKALGNGFAGVGVYAGSTGNLVGGTASEAGNVISGNGSYNILISDTGTGSNLVEGNIIGPDVTGSNSVGYIFADITIENGATNNSIGGIGAGMGNIIAFAGQPGVVVYGNNTTNNSIRGNSIFSNGNLGISFDNVGPTTNVIGNGNPGPNNLQNYPVITNVFGYATSTVVQGRFNSTTNHNFTIDVYRNLADDISYYGEGQFYVGTVSVTTDGNGNALFAFTNNSANESGQYFATTATDAAGDTSEFSFSVLATNKPAPSAQFTNSPAWHTNGFVFKMNIATNFTYRIQAATNLAANPVAWIDLTNFLATNVSLVFTDRMTTNFRTRFYRVISP